MLNDCHGLIACDGLHGCLLKPHKEERSKALFLEKVRRDPSRRWDAGLCPSRRRDAHPVKQTRSITAHPAQHVNHPPRRNPGEQAPRREIHHRRPKRKSDHRQQAKVVSSREGRQADPPRSHLLVRQPLLGRHRVHDRGCARAKQPCETNPVPQQPHPAAAPQPRTQTLLHGVTEQPDRSRHIKSDYVSSGVVAEVGASGLAKETRVGLFGEGR